MRFFFISTVTLIISLVFFGCPSSHDNDKPKSSEWRDENGIDSEGYNIEGYDKHGRDRQGFDRFGCKDNGFERHGYKCSDVKNFREGNIGYDDYLAKKSQYDSSVNSATNLRDQMTKLADEKSVLQSSLAKKGTKLESVTETVGKKSEEIRQLQRQLDDEKAQSERRMDELNRTLTAVIEKQANTARSLGEIVAQKSEEVNQLQRQLRDEKADSQERIRKLNRTLAELEEQANTAQRQCSQSKQRMVELEDQNQQITSQLEERREIETKTGDKEATRAMSELKQALIKAKLLEKKQDSDVDIATVTKTITDLIADATGDDEADKENAAPHNREPQTPPRRGTKTTLPKPSLENSPSKYLDLCDDKLKKLKAEQTCPKLRQKKKRVEGDITNH